MEERKEGRKVGKKEEKGREGEGEERKEERKGKEKEGKKKEETTILKLRRAAFAGYVNTLTRRMLSF
jgi:hypothetical protein